MPSYFITGTSRGIGLAIVEELLNDKKNFVIASARDPSASEGLSALSAKFSREHLAITQFDIADPESIKRGAAEATMLLPNGLDYLIHNAGVSLQPFTPFREVDFELFAKEVYHSTVAPLQIGNALLPLIHKSTVKKFAIITSNLGSFEISPQFFGLGDVYSVSKAALNMLARKWGATLKAEGITTILIHPGWVQTDMGDVIDDWMQTNYPQLIPNKLTAQQSAEGTIKVIHEAKLEEATSFFDVDGTRKPW
ncbi:hypothetical protein BD779DRAFT_1623750 [Infundibulicybe gibba]|nr:hypothetical protein BD779DRAFT_1623750 [Infundibulicybe gibba]